MRLPCCASIRTLAGSLVGAALAATLAGCAAASTATTTTSAETPSTLSGTVALGAPMLEGTVSVQDANGVVASVPVAGDGSYSGLSLVGMAAPLSLQACGTVDGTYGCYDGIVDPDGTGNVGRSRTERLSPTTTSCSGAPHRFQAHPPASGRRRRRRSARVTRRQVGAERVQRCAIACEHLRRRLAARRGGERQPELRGDAGERRVATDQRRRRLGQLAAAALDRRCLAADLRAEQIELPMRRRQAPLDRRGDAVLVVLEALVERGVLLGIAHWQLGDAGDAERFGQLAREREMALADRPRLGLHVGRRHRVRADERAREAEVVAEAKATARWPGTCASAARDCAATSSAWRASAASSCATPPRASESPAPSAENSASSIRPRTMKASVIAAV
jgi:hypothetical protein